MALLCDTTRRWSRRHYFELQERFPVNFPWVLLAICSIHHSQHKGRGTAGIFSQGGAPATPLPAAAAKSRARGEQKVTKAMLLPPAAHSGPRYVFTSSEAAAMYSYKVVIGGTPPCTAWHERESLSFTDNLRKAGRNNLG